MWPSMARTGVRIAVVVPTVHGRDAHLSRCVDAYRVSTARLAEDDELALYIERDHDTCGEAWRAGAARAEQDGFDYLHLTADDLEPHPGWIAPAVECVDEGFIPAPVVLEPDGTLQSAGINGWDCYRGPHVDWMHVESTTVPFMSRKQWQAVGMIPLHYCTDMWVSYRADRAGWPTRLRMDMVFTHHNAELARGAGMGQHPRTVHDRAEFARLVSA